MKKLRISLGLGIIGIISPPEIVNRFSISPTNQISSFLSPQRMRSSTCEHITKLLLLCRKKLGNKGVLSKPKILHVLGQEVKEPSSCVSVGLEDIFPNSETVQLLVHDFRASTMKEL